MKCRYTFNIEGVLKPSHDVIIPFGKKEYSFEVQNGFIRKLVVTVPNFPIEYTPQITPQNSGKVKAHINIPHDPYLYFIQEEIRTLEGLLSLYGVHQINTEHPEIQWLPENEEEKDKLQMYEFKSSYAEPDQKKFHPLPIDIIVRSIISSIEAQQIQIPLSFFRKGSIDVYEKRFIEAIYDFYFMLEICYGNGKTKNYAIQKEFCKSKELRVCIKKILQEKNGELNNDPKLAKIYSKNYSGKSPEDIISHFVGLRGFLHHHTLKRKDIWHPEKQNEYEVDATFLQKLCFEISFILAEPYIFSEETIAKHNTLKLRQKTKLTKASTGTKEKEKGTGE